VDDAVHAARAAAQEGIILGGGLDSPRAAEAVLTMCLERDEQLDARDLAKALEAPMATIASNAGYDASMVIAETREKGGNIGLNAGNGEWVDLVEAGVIDAAKVTRCALQNAASVTSLLLTSKSVIV